MDFRTELQPESSAWKVGYRDVVFSVGSCFAVHTGQKLLDYKFDALVNPFGTIYNPASLCRSIEMALTGIPLADDGFVQNQGSVRHFDLHSEISAPSEKALRQFFSSRCETVAGHLKGAALLLITFGTASVFHHRQLRRVVANCHKMPGTLFDRYHLDVDTIVDHFDHLYALLSAVNPGLQVVLTVSPVRHLRDTLPQSQLSKSILRVACDKIVTKRREVHYFPSYEIVMDDLRDYRFYEADLVHPNKMAVDYVWGKFAQTYFDEETREFIDAWSAIRKRLNHRPSLPGSPEHRNFVRETIDMLRRFDYTVDTSTEIQQLETQLND